MTILYFSDSNPYYLKYSIQQTVEHNLRARVILLGTESNRHLGLCEWYPLDRYFDSAEAFRRSYAHLSTNSYAFDLKCFQTWFVFKRFCDKENIDGEIVCLDHDVLLYTELKDFFERNPCVLATTRIIGNQYTYFQSREVLSDFIDFTVQHYTQPPLLLKLKKIANHETESPGPFPHLWVCDMTLLGLFYQSLGGKKIDLSDSVQDEVFDYAFHVDEGFDYNPCKRIKHLQYCPSRKKFFGIKSGQKLYFNGLHFQVGTKVFLPHYYTAKKRFTDRYWHRLVEYRGYFTTMVKRSLRMC